MTMEDLLKFKVISQRTAQDIPGSEDQKEGKYCLFAVCQAIALIATQLDWMAFWLLRCQQKLSTEIFEPYLSSLSLWVSTRYFPTLKRTAWQRENGMNLRSEWSPHSRDFAARETTVMGGRRNLHEKMITLIHQILPIYSWLNRMMMISNCSSKQPTSQQMPLQQ